MEVVIHIRGFPPKAPVVFLAVLTCMYCIVHSARAADVRVTGLFSQHSMFVPSLLARLREGVRCACCCCWDWHWFSACLHACRLTTVEGIGIEPPVFLCLSVLPIEKAPLFSQVTGDPGRLLVVV